MPAVRAGEATGPEGGNARQSGIAGQTQAAGNADASNYPGRVMRRFSRAGNPRVNARGTAVVSFTISAGGGLAAVLLARGSGSDRLDRAAVRLAQNTGHFPKPPSGARRDYSIRI